ncbi:DUF3492 domain-containing protein [Sporolactobacillus shoreae]|uniref:DUF3492 domain-containing protein n=1 Tax=Sporolactobacillus shoreae TaxID=1465501 RepID=A0A4Z0GPT3_9BACL|nr:GT4 family glycosyltransferase PelF [Sporolactobacillus shoreae]TGA98456.1 DUF3492 domain-containing protein [Sporolactobacillus shoreae]
MKIGLVVEGSYPFVSGGVANWVQMMIRKFPEHDFTVIAIVPSPKKREDSHYILPVNLNDLVIIPLQGEKKSEEFSSSLSSDDEDLIKNWFTFQSTDIHAVKIIGEAGKLGSPEGFLSSRTFYRIVRESYIQEKSSSPFSDYFWMWRSLFSPVIKLVQLKFKHFDLIHSVSTGYGGLLATSISADQNIPFILTEHGIYSREREEEILQADWIPIEYKSHWISFFYHLSRQAYAQARDVITLFGRNSVHQRESGAPTEKLKIIPNGVELSQYESVRAEKTENGRLTISAVIRIVPIKDVKTMIYSAKILADKGISFEFNLLGSESEEPEYVSECRELIANLHLNRHVFMRGKVEVSDYLKNTDVVVLTSVSEGQPLAILEAMASGIPCVVTDVGSCGELVNGRDDEFGPCGFVVPPVSPEKVAYYLEWFRDHPEKRKVYGHNGYLRVEKYYQLSSTIDSYRKLYAERGE